MRFLPALLLLALLAVAGCSRFATYDGPEVTRLIVNKSARQLVLMHHDEVLRTYGVELGFAPEGPKAVEGDGRTPEGSYIIDRRNPNSAFHLSLGISYPNEADIAFARARGLSPGGDIFIHGEATALAFFKPDWTAGCIAVTNREMEDVYAMVRDGTPITLTA